jgi:hypothetical protein
MTIKPTYKERVAGMKADLKNRGLGPPHEICLPLPLNKEEREVLGTLLLAHRLTSRVMWPKDMKTAREADKYHDLIVAIHDRLAALDPPKKKLAEKTTTKA